VSPRDADDDRLAPTTTFPNPVAHVAHDNDGDDNASLHLFDADADAHAHSDP
jgi:hypothetical protein